LINVSRTGPPNPPLGYMHCLDKIGATVTEGGRPKRKDIKLAVWFLESVRYPDAKGRIAPTKETLEAAYEHAAVLGHALDFVKKESGEDTESIRKGLVNHLLNNLREKGSEWTDLLDRLKKLMGEYFHIEW